MKRAVFEKYVVERLEQGYTAQEIIEELNDMINRFGQLELYDMNGRGVTIQKFWLDNFSYKPYIWAKAEIEGN